MVTNVLSVYWDSKGNEQQPLFSMLLTRYKLAIWLEYFGIKGFIIIKDCFDNQSESNHLVKTNGCDTSLLDLGWDVEVGYKRLEAYFNCSIKDLSK